jgi:hypothetical protein
MCKLTNLTSNCGDNTPPGTRADLYLIPAEELTAWPQTVLEATPNSTLAGADVTLNTAFQLVATSGKGYFRKYPILVDSGVLNTNTVGEKGLLSFENDLSFFLVGTNPERLSFAQNVANCCLVACIATREDPDNFIVLGRNDDPVKVSEIKMTTGAKAGDKPGGAYMLKDSGGRVPQVYPRTLGLDTTPNP